MDAKRVRLVLLAIVAAGVALRLLLAAALPIEQMSDAAWYVDRAREIAGGLGYQEGGIPTAFWPAGYPALLALALLVFGSTTLAVVVPNAIAAGVTIGLVGWLGLRLADARTAIAAALLYALYPAHIIYTGLALSEPVSTAFVLAGVALLLGEPRLRAAALAGLMFGIATTMRAQLMYFPIGLIVALAVLRPLPWRRATVMALVLHAGLFAAVLPLTLRNYQVLGAFVPVSTNGGVALRTGASDDATGHHLDWKRARWDAEGIGWENRVRHQVAADRILRRRAIDWIAANPERYIALMPVKAVTLWIKDSDAFWSLQGSYPGLARQLTLAQWANQGWYALLLLLSVPCLLAALHGWWRGRGERVLLVLFLMPVFVTLTAMIFTGQIRYHFAAMPFLAIAAGWTLARMTRRVRPAR